MKASLKTRSETPAESLLAASANVWDMTVPWPEIYWDIGVLKRYHECGYSFLSLTLQDLPATYDGVLSEVARFKALCEPHSDWLCFASELPEIDSARSSNKLVLGLNVQDTELVHDDFGRLHTLRQLGVRHMLLAYQTRNRAADGCAEPSDAGLSLFGRELVHAMNQAGIVVDVSHTGRQSSLDAMQVSDAPVIFSHSGALAICKHIRNIDDMQIKACADTGGVIGILGIGAFLGDPAASTDAVFRHIDHVVQLVGPEHVGIGSDFIDDMKPTWAAMEGSKTGAWRDPYGTQLYEGDAFRPEQLMPLIELMLNRGYSADAVQGILGNNFRRVYEHAENSVTIRP